MKLEIRHLLCVLLLLWSLAAVAQNPIVPMGIYIADPSSRVAQDGRLYVYGSTDVNVRDYCSNVYHVLSTDNATDWTLHRN
jgi:hypothetical protein